MLVNPHLEGDPFYWEGGPVGILLSHGLTATAAEVRPLARFLHARGYTVAGPLLPGHYTTPEDLNACRWQDWAAAVEKTYQELASRCQTVFLGGESTGAVLALYLAGDHPDAAGILAYAPALRLQLTRLDQLLLHLLAPYKTSIRKPVQNRAQNISDDLWQGYPVNALKSVLQLLRLQGVVRERLPAIHQPLLVIQGRLDPTVHPEVPAILSKETNSSFKEVVWMEQSAHCVMIDCEQDQVAAVTLQFIERVLV
jgi:carboxylesterase